MLSMFFLLVGVFKVESFEDLMSLSSIAFGFHLPKKQIQRDKVDVQSRPTKFTSANSPR